MMTIQIIIEDVMPRKSSMAELSPFMLGSADNPRRLIHDHVDQMLDSLGYPREEGAREEAVPHWTEQQLKQVKDDTKMLLSKVRDGQTAE